MEEQRVLRSRPQPGPESEAREGHHVPDSGSECGEGEEMYPHLCPVAQQPADHPRREGSEHECGDSEGQEDEQQLKPVPEQGDLMDHHEEDEGGECPAKELP